MPEHPEHDTKLKRAIQRIFTVWQETVADRGTQLVFCDLSTPDRTRWNVYDEVRGRLKQLGIPEKEIAFIHDADTDAKKKLLFDAVNTGRIRILMGSTEKMGAGTNVQRRLAALTHLDAPWRPRDAEAASASEDPHSFQAIEPQPGREEPLAVHDYAERNDSPPPHLRAVRPERRT